MPRYTELLRDTVGDLIALSEGMGCPASAETIGEVIAKAVVLRWYSREDDEARSLAVREYTPYFAGAARDALERRARGERL